MNKMGDEIIYRPKNYPGPEALNAIPSKEMIDYHKNAKVQINLSQEMKDAPNKII